MNTVHTINIKDFNGQKRTLQICVGDITDTSQSGTVDMLAISCFPDDYIPLPHTIVGQLSALGIDISLLARDKAVDNRATWQTWISQSLGAHSSFGRIVCFEHGLIKRPASVVGNLFRTLTEFALAPSIGRSVRIFLSSTFRDFGEERDLLVRKVFPALRARLKDRFVELVDVDLRWGISVEEAERGEVLPICLAEIDRSRPYFIGMLGERYGWIPPHEGYAPDLLERQPWLKKHQGGKSVTELEILHGVLKNKRMKTRAFFYFRSPAYARVKGGHYVPDSTGDRQRQLDLKRRIKDSGYLVTGYRDPEALAKRMERDLWKLLDAEFPASDVPDAFERESMRHEAYAAPRRRLYLGGELYQAKLEKELQSEEQRTVIEGESGSGKRALIANFFEAYRRRHHRHQVHKHYLGASTDSADPHTIVRRICEFIKRQTNTNEDIPNDPQNLIKELPLPLHAQQIGGLLAHPGGHTSRVSALLRSLGRQLTGLLGPIAFEPVVARKLPADGRFVSIQQLGNMSLIVSGFHKGVDLISFHLVEMFVVHGQLRLAGQEALNAKHSQPPSLQLIKVALRA